MEAYLDVLLEAKKLHKLNAIMGKGKTPSDITIKDIKGLVSYKNKQSDNFKKKTGKYKYELNNSKKGITLTNNETGYSSCFHIHNNNVGRLDPRAVVDIRDVILGKNLMDKYGN